MTLCECEPATGAPNGLSCEKEGFFLSSWEREGSWVRPVLFSLSSMERRCLLTPDAFVEAAWATCSVEGSVWGQKK
jgi:hypothetical protein